MTSQRGRRGRWAAAGLLTAVILLAACSTGANSVDATGGSGYGFVQQTAGQNFVPAGNRRPAPKMSGQTLDGANLDLASLRGKIVVVNFWASWCAPCRAETPGLVQLSKEDRGIAFVGVNEKEPVDNAKAFTRNFGKSYPSIVDRLGILAAGWPVAPGLPSTFVLDTAGHIAARFTGPVIPDDLKPIFSRLQAEA